MIRLKQKVHFRQDARGRHRIKRGDAARELEPGRIPRVARLMALAIRFDRLIQSGEVSDQSELARLAHVTQPRMTQIMNLLHLAPEIQESILFLPRTATGSDPIHEKMLRPIAAERCWQVQGHMWSTIEGSV